MERGDGGGRGGGERSWGERGRCEFTGRMHMQCIREIWGCLCAA